MNHFIMAAGYDIDTGMLVVMFCDGTTAEYYVSDYEATLRTSMAANSQLDWMLYEDPLTYAELMITGKMQEYLNSFASEQRSIQEGVRDQLRERFDNATAEYLAREFMRYDS